MNRDPDRYFTGEYDWYSTGSSLAVVDDDWLVHVQTQNGLMNQLSKSKEMINLQIIINYDMFLGLSKVTHKNNKIRLKPQDSIDKITKGLNKFGSIYELRTNEHHLSVRQKKHITIIDPIQRFKHSCFESEVPFVSSDFDTTSGNVFSADVKRIVKLWDLERQKPISTSNEIPSLPFAPSPDHWSCIRQFSPNIVAYSDRRSIRLFDTRNPISDANCIFTHELRKDLDHCEVVSCAEMVPSRSAIVVGTTHKLFAIDIRMEKDEENSLIKWVHQMQSRPTILSVSDSPVGELIFASGQVSGDIRFFETTMIPEHLYTSPYMPECPKSIADSYQVARRRGHLLCATSRARDQIRMCTTGMVQWNSNLITQNSMGDLFAQGFRLSPNASDKTLFDAEPIRIAEAMTQWDDELTLLATNTKPFYATDIVDLRSLSKEIARNMNSRNGFERSDDPIDQIPIEQAKPQHRPKWRQSAKRLNSYVDALAKTMLSIWDLPMEEEDHLGIGVPAKPSVTAVRIANWLENSVVEQPIDSEVTVTQDLNASTISSIPLSGATQIKLTQITQSQGQMPFTSTQTESPSAALKPPKKKARQSRVFVPGF